MAAPFPPGWYPDPGGSGGRRWWNGQMWTPHLAGGPQAIGPAPVLRAIEDERTFRPWARAAVWALPIISGVSAVLSVEVFRDVFDDFGQRLDELGQPGAAPSSPGLSPATSILSLVQVGALVVIGLWAMRAAEVGKRLGRPATRSPGWAIGGMFVPIVNFWFPYVSIVESLDPRTERGPVLRWWVAHVLSTFTFLLVLLLALAGVPTALLALGCTVVAVIVGGFGMGAIATVEADHEAVAALGAPVRAAVE